MYEPVCEKRLINRLTLRLIPLLGVLYLMAYIDRQNVSYAKLQMIDSLQMSEVTYGLGASLFFIGYLIFEVPSNMALYRVGAPRWLARIMLTWGAVTLMLAFTRSASMFYVLRFLLGAAEAGLYPGIIYYMTLWFPARHRARIMGYFVLGSAVGNLSGAAICGALLDLQGLWGLQGWQWVFIATGLPPVAMAFVTWRLLPAGPAMAKFLDNGERAWIARELGKEAVGHPAHGRVLDVLVDRRVLLLSCYFMMVSMSIAAVSYWMPTFVKAFGVSNSVNGLLASIPWLIVTVTLLWLPKRMGHGRQLLRRIAVAACIGILSFVCSALLTDNVWRFAALCLAAPCMYIIVPCFWTLPAEFLSGARAAAGIAAINSIGNVGGFLAQNLAPWIRNQTGSTAAPMLMPAACLVVVLFGTLLMLARRGRDGMARRHVQTEGIAR
ncbi:MFS transporter [Burkholderia diffusa]|uniref:MFS transporter n=1 Tax=Burkholderia diffusa TaxID=488732 RepID=UPI002AB18EB0|nr:MFS transporter [Burkholderia diffusa]